MPWTIADLFMEMLPQVHYRSYGFIKDTAKWVRVSKTYIPDSAYSHIMIGGFNDSTGSYSKDTVGPYTSYPIAYYLIDSVVIRPIYPTSTGNLQAVENIHLYPNPNNGKFVLNGTSLSGEELHISIFNMVGQLVYSHTTQSLPGALHEEIQLEDIPKGMYLMRVTGSASGSVVSRKFTVE